MTTRRDVMLAAAAAATLPLGAPLAQAAPFHRLRVGGLTVTIITDGEVMREAQRGFVVNASPEQVGQAMQAAGLPGTQIRNPYNVTFVETRGGLVALDAGTGAAPGGPTGMLLANMRAAGLDPARVTRVAQTHFHGDHIGGLAGADGTPVYPNAAVAVPEREWTFWTDAGEESRAGSRAPNFAMVRSRFAPYREKLRRFAPGAEVAPGIHAVATPGHSPGHTSFLVADGGAQLLVIGDAVTTPAFFLPNPEWYPVFDMDPPLAVETRKRLLDRAATERLAVVGYHFPMPATGRVERAGTGYRLVPADA
jgi:glyoxylase-like metal-dependent hydrolase (beta-lactamase superfamily II)